MGQLSIKDLDEIRQRAMQQTLLQEGAVSTRITVHMGTCGIAAGAREIKNTILDEIKKNNSDDILLTSSGCVGFCSREPMITIELIGEAPVKYVDLTTEKINKIFSIHVLGGKIVKEYALAKGYEKLY